MTTPAAPRLTRPLGLAFGLALALGWLAGDSAALAQNRAQGTGSGTGALAAVGGNSKDPIKIDADRLDVFDKDSKAVFVGNVIAVQGESTIRCSKMTILYDRNAASAPGGTTPAAAGSPTGAPDSAISRIECDGPVTLTSKTQTASGRHAVFDRARNRVIITGDVALADGPNILRGERIIYDTTTSIANIETTPGGRVRGFIVPGSTEPAPPARRN